MVREDIVYGLKNAMSRGQSLEQAMRSFISAGYDLNDVQEAARSMNIEFASNSKTEEKIQEQNPIPSNLYSQNQPLNEESQENNPQEQVVEQPKYQALPSQNTNLIIPQKKHSKLMVFLIIILALLIGGIAFMSIFGEKILDLIFK
jgi:hypothetical protein